MECIVRLPLTRSATEITNVRRLYVGLAGLAFPLPAAWLGGDISLRAFAAAIAQPPITWIDVFLSTDGAAECISEEYPTDEVQIRADAHLGIRLIANTLAQDMARRFWVPRLEELNPVPAAIYLIAMSNADDAWLEVALA